MNEMIMKQPYGVRRYCLFTVVVVYVTSYTACLPVNTWRSGECKRTEIRHERPHTSVRPAQSEKRWSCDWSWCRVDCGGGTDAEGGEPQAGPLLWFAASARSCRNLSKSERHSCKCCQHKSKQEVLGCFVFPVLDTRCGTFTGHPLAHGRLFLLCVQTQQHKTQNTRSDHHLFTLGQSMRGHTSSHRVAWQPSVNFICHRVFHCRRLRMKVQKVSA